MMIFEPGDTAYGAFPVSSGTGAATNADTTPNMSVWRNGVVDGAVTVTLTNPSTGLYLWSFVIPSGYALGDMVRLQVAATVGGVTLPPTSVFNVRLDRKISNVAAAVWAATTRTLTAYVTYSLQATSSTIAAIVGGVAPTFLFLLFRDADTQEVYRPIAPEWVNSGDVDFEAEGVDFAANYGWEIGNRDEGLWIADWPALGTTARNLIITLHSEPAYYSPPLASAEVRWVNGAIVETNVSPLLGRAPYRLTLLESPDASISGFTSDVWPLLCQLTNADGQPVPVTVAQLTATLTNLSGASVGTPTVDVVCEELGIIRVETTLPSSPGHYRLTVLRNVSVTNAARFGPVLIEVNRP